MKLDKRTSLPLRADIPDTMTRGDLVKILYHGCVYDHALPQEWVNDCREHGIDVRGRAVWIYLDGFLSGSPAALDAEFMDEYHNIFDVYPICPKTIGKCRLMESAKKEQ